MRLKAIFCQVLAREMEDVVSRSARTAGLESLTIGLHDLGDSIVEAV